MHKLNTRKLQSSHSIIILCVYFVVCLVVFLFISVKSILYPYGIDAVESFLLDQTNRLLTTGHLYLSTTVYNHLHPVAYPPVTHFILTPFIIFFGLDFWYGRLLAVTATLLICFVLFKLVSNQTRSLKLGVLASTLWISSGYVLYWGNLLRVDIFGVLFCLLALYFSLRSKSRLSFYACLFFSLLAVFTKQTFLLTIIPVLILVYFLKKDYQRLISYCILLFSTSLVSLVTIQRYEYGSFLLELVTINAIVPLNFQNFLYRNFEFLTTNFFLFLLISYLTISVFKESLRNRLRLKLISKIAIVYFLFSLINLVLISKVGSNTNYLLEIITAGSVLIPILFSEAKIKNDNLSLVILITLHIALQFTKLTYFSFFKQEHTFYSNEHFSYSERFFEKSEILNNVEISSNRLLFDEDNDLLVLTNKPIEIEPFITRNMIYSNVIGSDLVAKKIENKYFDSIVLRIYDGSFYYKYQTYNSDNTNYVNTQSLQAANHDFWFTEQAYSAITDNYKIKKIHPRFIIYERD